MELDYKHSLNISSQITYRNDLAQHKKYHIKYVKNLNVSTPLNLSEKREWHLFFRRMKILGKIKCTQDPNSSLEPPLPLAIEVLKGRKSLGSLPFKFKISESNEKANKSHARKLFQCLRVSKEISLSFHGKLEASLAYLMKETQVFCKINSYKLQLNSPSSGQVDISKAMKNLYKVLNRLPNLNKFNLYLQDIQISDNSLKELFQFNKLKKRLKTLNLQTDRLLDIEDEFDDFGAPEVQNDENPEALWEQFSNIESLAGSLTHLYLQPLLRSATDQNWLRYFFIPLGKLYNLRTLVLEMPNLELSDDDCRALARSISCLKNLKVAKMLAQFGMITQKALNDFFFGFEELDMHEISLNLTFSTMIDYSGFYRAISKNKKLHMINFEMTHLANVQFDPVACDFMLLCEELRSVKLSATPLMRGLTPHKEKFNACFRKLVPTLPRLTHLETFSLHSTKTSADNDNIRTVAEVLPQLQSLKEIFLEIDCKEIEVDYEIGLKFWEEILKKTDMRKIVLQVMFKGGEHLLPLLKRRLEGMKNLECLYVSFASETLGAEQIMLFIKRIKSFGWIKDLRLYFKVRLPLSNRLIERIQQLLKDDKYLKKGLVEIESVNGYQSISSESKSMFRHGQDFYYLD